MQEQNFRNNCHELLMDVYNNLDKSLDKVIKSGGIDIQSAEDSYKLPKAFVKAFLEDNLSRYNSLSGVIINQEKKEVENIKLYL